MSYLFQENDGALKRSRTANSSETTLTKDSNENHYEAVEVPCQNTVEEDGSRSV